jgi:hypothetical protein
MVQMRWPTKVRLKEMRCRKRLEIRETYLACCCFSLVSLTAKRNALVRETNLRPTQCESVQFLKTTALEIMTDDGDAHRINARELTEASDGEQNVLE